MTVTGDSDLRKAKAKYAHLQLRGKSFLAPLERYPFQFAQKQK